MLQHGLEESTAIKKICATYSEKNESFEFEFKEMKQIDKNTQLRDWFKDAYAIHIIAHMAHVITKNGVPQIVATMEESEDSIAIDAEILAKALKGNHRVKLLFLNGCESLPIARALNISGLPQSIVSWASPVVDELCFRFAQFFYSKLFADMKENIPSGETVQIAFDTARDQCSENLYYENSFTMIEGMQIRVHKYALIDPTNEKQACKIDFLNKTAEELEVLNKVRYIYVHLINHSTSLPINDQISRWNQKLFHQRFLIHYLELLVFSILFYLMLIFS